MPQTPTRLEGGQPIVDDNATMEQAFRTWTIRVTNSLLHVGTGSPEGILEAPQYSRYIDETVPAVPEEWIKMIPEIAADRRNGWIKAWPP